MKFHWAVLGGGPAGIAAVGKLLDQGICPKQIAWIDPAFRVGDFGEHFGQVPSNTQVHLFLKFLHAAESFGYHSRQKKFALDEVNPHDTCDLRLMAEPLQWITDQFQQKIATIQTTVQSLTLKEHTWVIQGAAKTLQAQNVILSIGAEPRTLEYPEWDTIPLYKALNSHEIKKHCSKDNTVALFGSSHSAILIMKNLLECGVKVINFYRSSLRYALHLEDQILFDNTGLKGSTAAWAKTVLHGKLPALLSRVHATQKNIQSYLSECDKAVYAIGFKTRSLPIEGINPADYIKQIGVIAPGLFGFGIAFPEVQMNSFGMLEERVGLWKFMDYLQRVMPIWLRYGLK